MTASRMRPFMVCSGRIKRLTVAATELDAAAKVLAEAIYEHLKSGRGELRLGKVTEIFSEDGTTRLLTMTGEPIEPPEAT
ncbi:MAG: hypothetical protein NWF14_00365 [Candidatus Bathyarchaeota archaeon]|nr:hypothetical protein [Candidatus Bathyarchaeota archaeon]